MNAQRLGDVVASFLRHDFDHVHIAVSAEGAAFAMLSGRVYNTAVLSAEVVEDFYDPSILGHLTGEELSKSLTGICASLEST